MNSWLFRLELLFQVEKRSTPSQRRKPNEPRYITPVQKSRYHSMPKKNFQIARPSKNPWNRIWKLATAFGLAREISRRTCKVCALQRFATHVSRRCIVDPVGVATRSARSRRLMSSETRPIEHSAMARQDLAPWSSRQNLTSPMTKPEKGL